jgi:hypothetical protein
LKLNKEDLDLTTSENKSDLNEKNYHLGQRQDPESNGGYRDEQILAQLLVLEPDAHHAPPCLFLPDLFSSLNESDLERQRGHSNTKSG